MSSIDFVPPTSEQIENVRKELSTNDNSITDAIKLLNDWLLKQPHLPNIMDRDILERMYINCKCSMERTKTALDMYFSLKTKLPEVMSARDPLGNDIQTVMNIVKFFPMPNLTKDGYRVHVSTGLHPDVARFNVDAYTKMMLMILAIRLKEDYVLGDIYIFDTNNFSLGHMAAMTVSRVRRMEITFTTAFCSRIKGIHFVNMNSVMEILYKTISTAVTKKLSKRVFVHSSNSDSLLKRLERESVPNELGGTGGSVESLWSAWKEKLISHRDWFLRDDLERSDESKRLSEFHHACPDLFGTDGSFRRLQVD